VGGPDPRGDRGPGRFQDWQAGAEGFEYPAGEARAAFRARVSRALERIAASGAANAAAVLHKGVIRELARQLTGAVLPKDEPPIGGVVVLTRVAGGPWIVGERSSDPPGLAASA
jgi:broad specificity phosphatase PhoE